MTPTQAFVLIRDNARSIKDSKRSEYVHDVTLHDGTTHEVWSSDIVKFAQQFV